MHYIECGLSRTFMPPALNILKEEIKRAFYKAFVLEFQEVGTDYELF